MLLPSLRAVLEEGEYVYGRVDEPLAGLRPFATVREVEGMTVVLDRKVADRYGIQSTFPCRRITLRIDSSLDAIGLTAVVSGALARLGISCNVVAGFHHDHLFVPANRAVEAEEALHELSQRAVQASGTCAPTAGKPDAAPAVLGQLGEPDVSISDPRRLLTDYLDWYRDRLLHKLAGLSETQLRAHVVPLSWSPMGLVKHLGWVERRWMRWGFAAEDVLPYPPGGDREEWDVQAHEPTAAVISTYREEVERSRTLAAGADLDEKARVGGRFQTPAQAPSLGRILVHLLQEYARHLGQLDVARELIDGVIGE